MDDTHSNISRSVSPAAPVGQGHSKRIGKKALIVTGILSLLAVASCTNEPQETSQEGNFEVELLFEKDGCKMYRFRDNRVVYWANCSGKVNSDHTTHSGKSRVMHHVEAITTE